MEEAIQLGYSRQAFDPKIARLRIQLFPPFVTPTASVFPRCDSHRSPMFLTNLQAASDWFQTLQTASLDQTAIMLLGPGETSAGEQRMHPESDRVLLVLDGEVLAQVAEEKATLRRGDVVFVPAGVSHRVLNNTQESARTLSIYTSPDVLGKV